MGVRDGEKRDPQNDAGGGLDRREYRGILKVSGGKLVRIRFSLSGGVIDDVVITGDFFLHPEEAIEGLEAALVGVPPRKDAVEESIAAFLREKKVEMIGLSPGDLGLLVEMALSGEQKS